MNSTANHLPLFCPAVSDVHRFHFFHLPILAHGSSSPLHFPAHVYFFFFYTIAIFVPSTLPHSLSLLLFRLWASSHNSHCNSSDVKEANQAGFSPVSFTMIVFDQFVSRLVMIVASFVTVGSH